MAQIETITGNISIVESSINGNTKKGDYIGFTYNGKHSSDLGIVRVSDGSRFNENLLPTMQDKTVQVPGADGTYYFGSYYTQKQFSVSFAFDSLTEFQVAQLKSHFGDKGIHDLIFDECPYKVYSAKVTGTATIKYIAFSEGVTNRLYKGEGSIQFTCYNPFARSRYKFLNLYSEENYSNGMEWADASGMRMSNIRVGDPRIIDVWFNDTEGKYSSIDQRFLIYNPGDLETDWILTIPFSSDGEIPATTIGLVNHVGKLQLSGISRQKEDYGIQLNSKTNLIEGCDSNYKKTGTLYNYAISSGGFFKIPIIKMAPRKENETSYDRDFKTEAITISNIKNKGITPTIQYNYLYF